MGVALGVAEGVGLGVADGVILQLVTAQNGPGGPLGLVLLAHPDFVNIAWTFGKFNVLFHGQRFWLNLDAL